MDKKGLNKWLKFSILVMAIAFIYYMFKKFLVPNLSTIIPISYAETLEDIIIFVVILILNYFFVKFSSAILKSYLLSKGEKRDVKLLISVYRYFVWFFVIFAAFSLLFEQIGSLITSIGLIGFGITLALQKPILNFVGWLTIIFGRSYKIGDIIRINNINGQIYNITVMNTYLSEMNNDGDHTGKSVSIPNEFILTSAVANFTRGSSYVWDEVSIYLTYKSNWKKALKIINKITEDLVNKYNKNMPKTIKEGYEKPVSRVNIYEKGVQIKIRYFIDFNIGNTVKTELSSKLLDELVKHKDITLGKTESVI